MDYNEIKVIEDLQDFLFDGKFTVWQYYELYNKFNKGKEGDIVPTFDAYTIDFKERLKFNCEYIIDIVISTAEEFDKEEQKIGHKYNTAQHICKESMKPICIYTPSIDGYKTGYYTLFFDLYLGTNGFECNIVNSLNLLTKIINDLNKPDGCKAYIYETHIDNLDDVYDFIVGVQFTL